MANLEYGGRSLDTTLAYLDSRREHYPSLLKALAVYGRIFGIQNRYHASFEPDLPADIAADDEGRAIFPGPLPGLGSDAPRQALEEISDAIAAASPDRHSEIESARASCERDGTLLRPHAGCGDHLSPTARTLLLLALNPFYSKLAREVVPSIEERSWESRQCPVCGESPSMGCYEASTGARRAQCRLCRTQWALGRVCCAFCGCEDADVLGYFQAEDDAAHRAEFCDSCGRYLKTVDERALGMEAILHVEELLMSALDREATARGYAPQ